MALEERTKNFRLGQPLLYCADFFKNQRNNLAKQIIGSPQYIVQMYKLFPNTNRKRLAKDRELAKEERFPNVTSPSPDPFVSYINPNDRVSEAEQNHTSSNIVESITFSSGTPRRVDFVTSINTFRQDFAPSITEAIFLLQIIDSCQNHPLLQKNLRK